MAEPAAAPDIVDIVLPDGGAGTVPSADLDAALAAGAKVAPKLTADEQFAQSGTGQALTGLIGAGRSATFGATDVIMSEGAGLVAALRGQDGEQARKATLRGLQMAKEANPYADMAGEGAGMLLGGGGLSHAGEAAEGAVAGRLGEGLLGKTLTAGARGAAEGAYMGLQDQATEDRLGDHQLDGEKYWAAIGKNALLGGAAGAALGAGFGLLSRPGPAARATLDDVVGMKGAGAAVREEAGDAEKLIAEMQAGGATSEQAAKMSDDVRELASLKAKGAPQTLIDQYISVRSNGDEKMAKLLSSGTEARFQRLADRDGALTKHSLDLKDVGDRVMTTERKLNDLQFRYKADQMAKLVDPSLETAARDSYAVMLQDTNKTLDFLDSLATKGGSEGAVAKLRKEAADAARFQATLGRTADGKIAKLEPKQMHELFIRADKLKRAVGNAAGAGKSFGLTEAQGEFRDLYEKLRVGLENEDAWGRAASAQKAWNETFSQDLGRADDFSKRFGATIENEGWAKNTEIDAGKVKSFLRNLGDDAASQQGTLSTDAWIARNEARIAKMEEFGTLSKADRAALDDGKSALAEFRSKMGTAREEAATLSALEQQRLSESGPSLGRGLFGLASDVVTKPLTTVERLVRVQKTTRQVTDAVKKGVEQLFDKGAYGRATKAAVAAAPRPAATVAKEIGEIRQLSGNPQMLQDRINKMVGDLDKHAPAIAAEVRANAVRAIHYLAQEAPQPSSKPGIFDSSRSSPRYPAQALAAWDAKRQAVLGGEGGQMSPQVVLYGLSNGRLNRDAIRMMELTSPRLFAEMQDLTRQKLAQLEATGKLDKMPYSQKATIAALIKVPADPSWEPAFIAAMQANKAASLAPTPDQSQVQGPNMGVSKRKVEMNTDGYATEAQQIEGSGDNV